MGQSARFRAIRHERRTFRTLIAYGAKPRLFPRTNDSSARADVPGANGLLFATSAAAMQNSDKTESRDLNRDPITGEPGSHPLGTGVGSAGGAVSGAAIGALGGPIGAAIGGVIGAIAGGLAGHSVAEDIDPTAESAYWEENYESEPYHSGEYKYSDYEPAYRMGYSGYSAYRGNRYEDAEPHLANDWDNYKGESRLKWEHAKDAVRAGWHRVEDKLPGDADHDGH